MSSVNVILCFGKSNLYFNILTIKMEKLVSETLLYISILEVNENDNKLI